MVGLRAAVLLLDLIGIGLIVYAAWLWSPVIGLAIGGFACLAIANVIEPKVPR